MEITIKGEPKEIAALVFAVQERQREVLICGKQFSDDVWKTEKVFDKNGRFKIKRKQDVKE